MARFRLAGSKWAAAGPSPEIEGSVVAFGLVLALDERDMSSSFLKILHALSRYATAVHCQSQRAAVSHDVTGLELECLRWIAASQPVDFEELCDRTGLTPAAQMTLLDGLEGRDMISLRLIDAPPGRERATVTLTDRGVVLLETAPAPLHERLAPAIARLSPGEQTLLAEAAYIFSDLLEDELEEPSEVSGWPMPVGKG